MRTPLLLFVIALIVHGLWALTIPAPVDWDPAYYRSVARNIAAGEGAVIGAAWHLVAPPDALPQPADLHWMPLPSRALVPGVWLWPARGDQLVTVLLAALWAPLAWALARRLVGGWAGTKAREPRAAALAGGLAIAGGAYARFLSTPDSIALYGALGSACWLALAGRRVGAAALLAAAAALCRGDGFLLGCCAALALVPRGEGGRWRDAALVFAAGPLAFAGWSARSWFVGGQDWLARREASANALDLADLVRGEVPAIGPGDRLAALAGALPEVPGTVLLIGAGVLPIFALGGAWLTRDRPLVQAAAAYAIAMPVVTALAAPGVAASGTLFRSGGALFPLACALAAIAAARAGGWAARERGYPTWFLPGLLGLGFWIGSIGIGVGTWQARPSGGEDCQILGDLAPGEVIFAGDPLRVEALCGARAVALPEGLDPARAQALADRYGIERALLAAPGQGGGMGAEPADAGGLLPGWTAAGERLYLRR